jgi:hypothetical protein
VAGPTGEAGPAGTTGQDAATVFSTAGVSFSNLVCLSIPGLTASVQVPSNSVIVVTADGSIQLNAGASTNALVDLRFIVDGTMLANSLHRLTVSNTPAVTPGFGTFAMTRALTLDPGLHTITVCGQLVTGSATAFSGSPTGTPDNLTVMILKK